MVITAIERQKKRNQRVSIFVDGKFALGIHENVLVKYGLRKGDAIDERTMRVISNDEEFNSAKDKALRLMSYRLRSEKELRERLKKEEYPAAAIDRALEHLRSLRLLDDTAFAHALVHDLILKKSAGKTLLQRELRKKGISKEIIADTLREMNDSEEEIERALNVARTLLKRYQTSRKSTEVKKQQQRITAFLMRRGFEFSIINKVTRKLFNTIPEETDES